MHPDDPLSDAERRLRRALRPGDDRVKDVIDRALSTAGRPRPARVVRLLPAAIVALIAAGVLAWRTWAPGAPALTIRGSGSVIVVTSEDGRRWVVDERDAPAARGQYVIVVPQ